MDFFNDEKIQNIVEILEIVLLMVIVGLLIWDRFFREEKHEEVKTQESVTVKEEVVPTEPVIKEYKVDIKGAVKNPGVYTLNQGSVINDLIAAAGGTKSGANLKNINLSKKIEDEMVVYVYTTNELNKLKVDVNESKECVCPTYDISSCEGTSVVKVSGNSTTSSTSETKPSTETTNQKVNINTDGIDRLTTLTGIGEAKAKAIIEYREQNGGFKSIEEIKNISGIGDASFEKIKDNITI